MHYDEVVAAVFDAPPFPGTPHPTVDPSPARALRDAIEPLAMHAVWSPGTNAALAMHGLDFFGSYVWGRAAALGEPSPSVVAATFAVFEPDTITGVYDAARALVDRDTLLAARTEATTTSLTDTLIAAEVALEDVERIATVLERAVDAADPLGRPLFAGLADQPRPGDPAGRLWRACDLLREHRGDAHVATCVSRGLDAPTMNVLTERWLGLPLFSYSATRFWPQERLDAAVDGLRSCGWMDGDELTDAARTARDEIEARTDALDQPIVDAIGSDLRPVVERCSAWAQACVDARLFPPDPYKRAAG